MLILWCYFARPSPFTRVMSTRRKQTDKDNESDNLVNKQSRLTILFVVVIVLFAPESRSIGGRGYRFPRTTDLVSVQYMIRRGCVCTKAPPVNPCLLWQGGSILESRGKGNAKYLRWMHLR